MLNFSHEKGSFLTEGINALNQKQYSLAKELLLIAIRVNPEVSESYFFLGKVYFLSDNRKNARVHLKKYIELNTNNTNEVANISYAFDLLGQCYESENKDTLAIDCYKTATKINPSCASAWHNMGLLYMKSAQHYLNSNIQESLELFDLAQVFLKKALALCDGNALFLHSIASWYEKFVEALEQLTDNEEAVQQLISNNFEFAIQHYKKALTACDKNDIALNNIIRANLTECLAQFGHHLYSAENYEQAQRHYLQAIALDGSHIAAINQMGMCFFKQNVYSKARTYFSAILDRTEDNQELADAWLNVACTYRSEQNWDEAEKSLIQAKKLSPEDASILKEEHTLLQTKMQALLITNSQTLFANVESNLNLANSDTQDTFQPPSSPAKRN